MTKHIDKDTRMKILAMGEARHSAVSIPKDFKVSREAVCEIFKRF